MSLNINIKDKTMEISLNNHANYLKLYMVCTGNESKWNIICYCNTYKEADALADKLNEANPDEYAEEYWAYDDYVEIDVKLSASINIKDGLLNFGKGGSYDT